jgi:hypothetical protein
MSLANQIATPFLETKTVIVEGRPAGYETSPG